MTTYTDKVEFSNQSLMLNLVDRAVALRNQKPDINTQALNLRRVGVTVEAGQGVVKMTTSDEYQHGNLVNGVRFGAEEVLVGILGSVKIFDDKLQKDAVSWLYSDEKEKKRFSNNLEVAVELVKSAAEAIGLSENDVKNVFSNFINRSKGIIQVEDGQESAVPILLANF